MNRRTFLAQGVLASAAGSGRKILRLSRDQKTGTNGVLASTPQPVAAATSAATRETASLDGRWHIVFDRMNKGRTAGWHRQATFENLPDRKAIEVPCCWETIEEDYEGVGWYGRRFRVPASWENHLVRIRFGAVNYRAEVWINDQPAGFHEAGYTPFEIMIGDLLKPGAENFIVVRVIGPIITRFGLVIDGIGANEMPHWRGAIGGGIWQSVELIATSQTYLSDVFVEPDVHSSQAVIHAKIANLGGCYTKAVLKLGLSGMAGALAQALTLRPGSNAVRLPLHIPNAQLWAPGHPNLYTLQARLLVSDHVADAVDQRFGMREFTIRDNSYYLNGQRIYIKAGFWEGLYPGTLALPPNTDVVRREIRLAKEAGFNVLRPWRKPQPPPILDIADEMGIMIIGTPPIECMAYWPQLVPETDRRIATEIRELVLRDRNHPSLIYWELFNEILRPGLKRLKHSMSLLARDLDPSRIVIDESGGLSGGTSAYLPHRYEGEAVNDWHNYKRAPVDARTYDFYMNLASPGFDVRRLGPRRVFVPNTLTAVTEFGYGGMPDFPANVQQYDRGGNPLTPDYRYNHSLLASIQKAWREMEWQGVFKDVSALCLASQRVQAEGNKLLIEALRLNPRVAGYCIHAFTGGDWVLGAGVLDLFRNPKLEYETIKLAQQPLYLAVRLAPVNVRTDEPARIHVRSVNEGSATRGVLKIAIVDPNNRVIFRYQKQVSINAGVEKLLEMKLPALKRSGTHRVRASFEAGDNGKRFENECEFYALARKDLRPPASRVAVLDPESELTPFMTAHGFHYQAFSGRETSEPVIVATETAQDEDTFRQFVRLLDYVERGGIAVLLKPPLARTQTMAGQRRHEFGRKVVFTSQNTLLQTGLFPLKLRTRNARGMWNPVNHGVRAHPVFEGLPVNDFMGQIYQNVCAAETIEGLNVPPIVGSISWDYSPQKNWEVPPERRLLNYRGPGDAWWGADMASVPYGRGRLVFSTLRIQENLEADPVAERILYNLIGWAVSISRRVAPVRAGLQGRTEEFVRAYRSLGRPNSG
ncbi:MAG: glycoside hydrolase family 2 TIM barrel-domain containing protein [Acidobacteriota bacterium]